MTGFACVRRICVLALGVLLLFAAPALAAPQVNGTFSVTGLGIDNQITQGPDGNMWVTVNDAADNDVARITPAGNVQKFNLTDVNGPIGIASRGGRLWVTRLGGVASFTPANPATTDENFNEVTLNNANGITRGPDNNLWAVSAGNVVKITPNADPTVAPTFQAFPLLLANGRQIAPGAGNTLWATGGTRVVNLTTAGVNVADSPYEVGGNVQDIAAGPGNQAAYGNPGTSPQSIGRITPPGPPQLTNLGALDAGFGVAFGNDGAYWITQYNGDNLRRFTPQGQSTVLGGFPAAPAALGPRQITNGPNNTLWVTLDEPGADINDKVARVTGVTPPPPPPSGCTTNEFTIDRAKKNKRRGTAKQTVTLPCPGELALEGKKVKPVTVDVEALAAGAQDQIEVKLKVKAKGKARKRLKRTGKAKVKMEITYTPTGGEPNTESDKLKLKKKRR